MARKRNAPSVPHSLPKLVIPRSEAFSKIQARIERGQEFINLTINSSAELQTAKSDRQKWSDYNVELLARLFDNQAIADEYPSHLEFVIVDDERKGLQNDLLVFKSNVQDEIERLESIRDRLELIPETDGVAKRTASKGATYGSDIFIVHGHDNEVKETVARFIERLGLRAVILHEQSSQGKTIIEKFEAYSEASAIGFAIVLLTPDDVGTAKGNERGLRNRARQNVVFELGFFIGKLGRKRVCALLKGDIEIPSDYSGVLYLKLDGDLGWKLLLAKEMKSVGLPVDLNKAM